MTQALIAYARCSTDRQDLSAQRKALQDLGVSKNAIAKVTGVSRPTLYHFINSRHLQPGHSRAFARGYGSYPQQEALAVQSAIRKTGACPSLAAGLLAFAAIFIWAAPALAQQDCPLPEGVTALADPPVTAQQVEDGSASLADFGLAVRDVFVGESEGMVDFKIPTLTELSYVGCLFRREEGPWRSGSTYIVRLIPSDRVFIHAKDMSLSGHRLDPVIYNAVLRALGIDPAELTGLAASVEAFTAAAARPGAEFNVPGIPGASGYAFALLSGIARTPVIMLAGFDLDASHLAEEEIEHIDPPVTASEVVDRESLKAFVTAAGEYFVGLLGTGENTAISKARVILRDPNGPWRHGPVYVAIMARHSRIITLHAAFPNRFEFQRGGIATDIATGELVVDQLVRAAESDPDGDFWLYYFDNPDDDTDSADVPKVGYARVFTAHLPLPDGISIVEIDYIINSGFYLTSDGEFVQRILAALDDGQESMMFSIASLEDDDLVAGDGVAVSVVGAPTDTVHFAYRPAGVPDAAFTYLGAATNREDGASFAWDTLGLPDDYYELAALYTEDEGYSVVYDSIEVGVDNVAGGGGCAAVPVLPGGGGPFDPTLPALAALLLVYAACRRRPLRQAALG